jgi:hypothetical protein
VSKTNLEAAWDELLVAKPPRWWVGSPSYHPEREKWLLYAYDPSEREGWHSQPRVGSRGTDRGVRRARDGPLPTRDWRRQSTTLTAERQRLRIRSLRLHDD